MMYSSVKKAAKPTKTLFDPWNSSSTGHQRAENRLSGSTSWRESRTRKLKEQFGDRSERGGKRLYDTVGAGSEEFGEDGRLENGAWLRGASGLRKDGQQSIQEVIVRSEASKDPAADCEPPAKRRKMVPLEQSPKDASYMPGGEFRMGEERTLVVTANKSLTSYPTMKTSNNNSQSEKHHQEIEEAAMHEQANNSQPPATPLGTQSQPKSQTSQIASSGTSVSLDMGFSPAGPPPPKCQPTSLSTEGNEKTPSKPPKQKRDPYPDNITPKARRISRVATTAQDSPPPKSIFAGLNFYINGSTYPAISDHKLKQTISRHGGSVSLGLARRTVTHVIIGDLSKNGGCGGGLASSKIQKEAALGSKGEGVKYIKVEWIIDCVKMGKRVSEAEYQVEGLGTGGARQRSVMSMFKRKA